jgi:hypothetical protein
MRLAAGDDDGAPCPKPVGEAGRAAGVERHLLRHAALRERRDFGHARAEAAHILLGEQDRHVEHVRRLHEQQRIGDGGLAALYRRHQAGLEVDDQQRRGAAVDCQHQSVIAPSR